MKACKMNYFS